MLTGNQQDAEDLAQDTLIKVHQRWTRVVGSRDRAAYVHHMLINHFLSGKRKRVVGAVELREVETCDHPDFADRLTERAALADALRELPVRERTAVVLKYYLHMNTREMAAAMGITESSARSTLSRGIHSLRRALQPVDHPS